MKKLFVALLTGAFLSTAGFAETVVAKTLTGYASYYKKGRRTANGERFNPYGLTAAHRSLPFGTRVQVTNMRTGRSVVVRINDRGPFIRGRVIDLSLGAAQVVGLNRSGVAKVQLVVLD
ncbi:MAG: septal ring lytic transglycosylase RlpA family protein [Rhizobiales bacterium]|nr:septal ring lytic transglycosylase RlpA family protein [Hyphomicrobiales bacterium]